jgi:hypothetical protein
VQALRQSDINRQNDHDGEREQQRQREAPAIPNRKRPPVFIDLVSPPRPRRQRTHLKIEPVSDAPAMIEPGSDTHSKIEHGLDAPTLPKTIHNGPNAPGLNASNALNAPNAPGIDAAGSNAPNAPGRNAAAPNAPNAPNVLGPNAHGPSAPMAPAIHARQAWSLQSLIQLPADNTAGRSENHTGRSDMARPTTPRSAQASSTGSNITKTVPSSADWPIVPEVSPLGPYLPPRLPDLDSSNCSRVEIRNRLRDL